MSFQIGIGKIGKITEEKNIYNTSVGSAEKISAARAIESVQDARKVFIIHGHNEAKWRELSSMLHKLKLEPIELSEQIMNGSTIIEKFEYYANLCDFAIAVFTYDDVVYKDGEEYLQVRPNVIFELGWFYAKLGREKVMIIEQKNDKGNIFSDLAGIYRYIFSEKVSELYGEIMDTLKKEDVLS